MPHSLEIRGHNSHDQKRLLELFPEATHSETIEDSVFLHFHSFTTALYYMDHRPAGLADTELRLDVRDCNILSCTGLPANAGKKEVISTLLSKTDLKETNELWRKSTTSTQFLELSSSLLSIFALGDKVLFKPVCVISFIALCDSFGQVDVIRFPRVMERTKPWRSSLLEMIQVLLWI